MTSKADRFGVIRLSAPQLQHPALLTGLEAWLQLDLLSQDQVKQFCQDYLTCAVPPVRIAASSDLAVPARQTADRTNRELAPLSTTDFADAEPEPSQQHSQDRRTRPLTRSSSNWMTRTLQSFMAEIGVIWLLGLGVFMVVVSSGVLAASQWRNFSAVGQYGILLAYTLAFWGVGLWTERQPALQLTTRMLQTATLLIIPVNFWMMDGLNLWQTPTGIGLNLLAALLLTAVMLKLTPRLSSTEAHRLTISNSLGLSWLHWGWSIAGIPLVATYIGTIGTALLTYLRARRSQADPDAPADLSLTTLIIALATLLLLGRAILAAQVPLDQLGLAFGVCGWLFCWLTRPTAREPFANLWTTIGAALLLLGWAITVSANPPSQALAISGLGLWLLGDRLRRQGTETQLLGLLLVGLQTYILLWRILPAAWLQSLVDTAAQLMGTDGMPIVLLGLAGFPYLWLVLSLANRLRPQNPRLAQRAELTALVFGVLMSAISCLNPIVRSLNLTLSAITFTVILRRRTAASGWVYFNHGLILVALFSWINASLPDLSYLAWARIVLVGMAIEWGLSLGNLGLWRRSCWHFGLALAGLSYALLSAWFNDAAVWSNQNLIWLVAPALLTGLARLRQFHSPRAAAWLSSTGLIAELFLLNSVNGWMIALGLAIGLMAMNTLTLQQFVPALLTIGFALGFEAVGFYRYFSDFLTFDWVLLLLAANLWLLWLSEEWLIGRDRVSQLYGVAANAWAVAIGLFSLISLSLYSFAVYSLNSWTDSWALSAKLVISSGLIALAIAYRLWSRRSANLNFYGGFYGLAWAIELVAVTLIGWQTRSIEALAIVTMVFGLSSQIAGDVWVRRSGQTYPTSWQLIPLLYAGLGALLGHHLFTATTGLYTLIAALIGIGVGRRESRFKPLTLAALLLISIATYELLIYQLMQATGGAPGDGVTLLAGLAAVIAIGVWLCQRWLLPYLRLSSQEMAWFAHLHWGMGSGLAGLALPLSLSDNGFLLWFGFAIVLTGYALMHGRQPRSSELILHGSPADRWTYFGILEAWGVISYGLYRTIPETEQLMAWAATIAVIVAVLMYFLPWRSWGWAKQPWQTMAMLLPGGIVLLTASEIALQSLLIVAAFYAWIAKAERRPRLSYLSLLLFDWATLRFLTSEGWLSLLWISSLMAASLLYVAQIDPYLRDVSAKEQRHWLRSLAVGLLSLTLFYQAEMEADPTALLIRLLSLGIAIGLVFSGLVLRVRAFLYVGTGTFILAVLRVLWLFINNYSLLLWAVGIVIGLLFIWLAATFEARRNQMNALMQYWLSELAHWE